MHFVFIDDDSDVTDLLRATAKALGHESAVLPNSDDIVSAIGTLKPDAVLIDLMMPGLDGFAICEKLRAETSLDHMKIVVLSAKSYDFDKRRARSLGANGFLTKPFDANDTIAKLESIVRDETDVTFWGVRGTLPVGGPKTLRYGSNTPCITVQSAEDDLLILDAGTGIRELSSSLMARGNQRLEATILISHPHWDHINAFPFFVPLFVPGNQITVAAASHGSISTEELVSAQMDSLYFPITQREFGAHVRYQDLAEGTYQFGKFNVDTLLLSHPGQCLGYRIYRDAGRSVCYVTDNEMFLEGSPSHNPRYFEQLCDFVRGTDVLITDCTYMDDEYPGKEGWGHSCVSEVVRLAHAADVKELCLFHHDPDQTDDDIDRKLASAVEQLAELGSNVVCTAPSEGDTRAF